MKSFLFDAVLFGGVIGILLVNHYGSLRCAYDSILTGSDCRAIPAKEINSVTSSKW